MSGETDCARTVDVFRYFSVTMFAEWVEGPSTLVRRPVSLVHAKEMGTSRTACGIDCTTWEKFWHEPFTIAHTTCPACAVATADAEPAPAKSEAGTGRP